MSRCFGTVISNDGKNTFINLSIEEIYIKLFNQKYIKIFFDRKLYDSLVKRQYIL